MHVVPDNAQHIGARDRQQDAFGFSDLQRNDVLLTSGALGVVADGMGGMERGEEMSRLACRAMIETYSGKAVGDSVPTALSRALHAANDAVLRRASELSAEGRSGTTLAAAVIHEGSLHWISVGDTRVYLHRGGRLTRLTADHVYVHHLNRQVAAGEVTRQTAEEHPERHALTSYLGLEALPEIDRSLKPFPLDAGDRVLLCSDGVHGVVSDDDICAVLNSSKQHAAQALVDAVLARQYTNQDNVTAALMDYEPETPSVGWLSRLLHPAIVAGIVGRQRQVLAAVVVLLILAAVAVTRVTRGSGAWNWMSPAGAVAAPIDAWMRSWMGLAGTPMQQEAAPPAATDSSASTPVNAVPPKADPVTDAAEAPSAGAPNGSSAPRRHNPPETPATQAVPRQSEADRPQ